MPFAETKVYFDGSHYIAIPHTTRPTKRRPYKIEETITVQEEVKDSTENVEPSISLENDTEDIKVIESLEEDTNENIIEEEQPKKLRRTTKKELFNELYRKYIDLKKNERKKMIVKEMEEYFESKQQCIDFVNNNFERKQRNLICRRIRMVRKANLVNFNYFCTFTYDDKKHTEQTFKKKLQTCFKMMCHRKNWKYMGVWERAPKTKRLHFHGLFSIPENAMVGEVISVRDYNLNSHKMQETYQNSYFNERFGRSDFDKVNKNKMSEAIQYLIKYIEKTEEKIVYSKGLYQYFISDILDEDVVSRIGLEDKKLLLFDDFKCFDEGEYIGKVSLDTINKMRKCN